MSDTVKVSKRLIIEGNVGAGKSTFLKMATNYLDIEGVLEPHDKWQNAGGGENLLDKFYKDTERWAYTFQTYAFVSRVVEQERRALSAERPVQVLERSVFSDRYCFAKNCYEMGLMTKLEWELYQEWFSWLVESYTIKPSGFIYLKTDPKISFERIQKRDRSEESGTSFEYFQKLHDKHEEWLVEKKGVEDYLKDVPVLVLECDKDFAQDLTEQRKHIEKIAQFYDVDILAAPHTDAPAVSSGISSL